uniref:Phytocyanin domain-containing protein n=1 Tax=Opuntia streptacantha TaxID=393608 RepID=A0A7C8Z7L0_OPUST
MMRIRFGCVATGLFVVCLAVPCLATVYTVGDSAGWTLGADYNSWSSSKTFVVGDSLVFNYGSGHTVDEVSQGDYSTCTDSNPLSTDNKGSTTILLQAPGPRYFICGIIGHCSSGMKLSVNVVAVGTSSSFPPNSTASGTPAITGPGCGTPATPATPTIPTMFPYSASSPMSLSQLHGRLIVFATALAFKLPLFL